MTYVEVRVVSYILMCFHMFFYIIILLNSFVTTLLSDGTKLQTSCPTIKSQTCFFEKTCAQNMRKELQHIKIEHFVYCVARHVIVRSLTDCSKSPFHRLSIVFIYKFPSI